MRLITKLMLTLMLFIVCIGVNAEKKYLTFSCAEYCAAQWNSETNTLTWGSGGWNSAWTFMAADGISGDLSEWQSLHLNAKEFTNSQKEELTVVFKKNDGSNPPSGPTKEFVVAPDANGDITIDLTTVEWGDCDITNIQDLTIYGGARTDANQNASVVVTDAYFEKADAAPIATVVTWDATAQNYANQTEISTVNLDEKINAVFDKNTNSNVPKYYTNGTAVRIYGGSTITISGEKVAISKIEFTFGSSDGTNEITADKGTYADGVWTIEGNTNIVKFTIGGTTGNRRITAIKVTYTIDENAAPLPQPVHIENTAETAYTVAEAIALIDAGEALSETVFVKGIVSKVDKFDESKKYITYWISADGTTEGAQFECYQGKNIDGADFASIDDVKVGAEVIVKGTMTKYQETYEFNKDNELVSYVAPVKPADPIAATLIKPTSFVDTEFTSVADLAGVSFAIINKAEEKALYGSNAQNLAYGTYANAFSSSNSGYLWKLVSLADDADADVHAYYRFQLITPTGADYSCWGWGGWLNSQPANKDCSFILGLNNQNGQDMKNGAVYDVQYVEGQGFTIKNIGTGLYQGANNGPAKNEEPTYFTFATVSSTYVPALEALLAEGAEYKAIVKDETALTAYDTAIAGIDATAITGDGLEEAKKVDAAITELAKAVPAIAGQNYTRAIVNPSFEIGNTNGWTSNNGGGAANNGNFHQATGSFFVEKWTDSANGGKLSDGSLTQVIAGLPAGKYKLTAEMQNLEQGNGDAAGKGFYLIANTDSMAVAVSGETVAVETELAKGAELTIGAAMKDCSGNWVCVDNFQLTLVEPAPATIDEDPELVAPEGWTSAIANGNLATDNVESFFSKEAGKDTNPVASTITAGAGKNESRGIAVSSQDKVKDAWESQFFIKFNEVMPVGTKVHVQFDCKADKAATIGTQAHAAPGSYKGNNAIGQVAFTAEWATFTKDFDVTDEGMQSIAFNLNDLAAANTYYFDNFGVWVQKPAPVEDWVDIVVNGNMESDDASCFYVTEQGVGGPYVAKFTENIGKDGSKAIKIQSADKPANAWDTQFFVRLPYQLPAGTKYKISFDIKADAAAKSSTQIHTEPGGWKGNAFGDVNFTTEWQSFEKEGNVAADMQTFVFNLAELATANVYIFDNVKVEISEAVKNTLTLNPATNPVAYPSEAVLAARAELKAAIADAEAIDTTDKLGVEELTAAIAEAKKHELANTLEEIETAKAALASAIAAFNEANKPVVTHTWDFTKWSEATVANLKAEAAKVTVSADPDKEGNTKCEDNGALWSDHEKKPGTTCDTYAASKDNCFWYVGGEATPTANGTAIAEFAGLQFNTAYGASRALAIAVNYPSTSIGTYNGPSYLWFGGKNQTIMTIPAVKGGSTIKIGVESHKSSEARGIQLFAGETELKDAEGNAVAAPKTYTEQTWVVPAGVAYDIVVKNTNGCHIYFIDAEQDENTLTSINTVKSNVMNNAIYNLNGQKVNKAQKGLFIINGKKVVM